MSEWISVKDRLPKTDDYYLIYGLNDDMRLGYWSTKYNKFIAFDDDGYDYELYHITHWQPLPEPPKESDTNA